MRLEQYWGLNIPAEVCCGLNIRHRVRCKCPLQACPARVMPESPGFDDRSRAIFQRRPVTGGFGVRRRGLRRSRTCEGVRR
jgi:hypothetical protein